MDGAAIYRNGGSHIQPGVDIVKEFDIEQGFIATVRSDLRSYQVMLRNGHWTYGPAVARISVVKEKLNGETPEDNMRMFAYAIKAQAMQELSRGFIDDAMKQTQPGLRNLEPE